MGAHAVGMQTALIVDGGMAPPMQTGRTTVSPDHTIHSLSELRAIVAAWIARRAFDPAIVYYESVTEPLTESPENLDGHRQEKRSYRRH